MLQTQLKLGPTDQGRVMSAEEFAEADFEDSHRYERVEGRLVVMSPSGKAHNQVAWAILKRLSIYEAKQPDIIEMVVQEGWMRTRHTNDRIGDVAVYLTLDEPQPDLQYEMVPGIIFEIVSEGSEERDYVTKRKEYYDIGIREYVIVDPFRQVVTVLTRDRQDYVGRELHLGSVYTSTQLVGFELPLSDLPWD